MSGEGTHRGRGVLWATLAVGGLLIGGSVVALSGDDEALLGSGAPSCSSATPSSSGSQAVPLGGELPVGSSITTGVTVSLPSEANDLGDTTVPCGADDASENTVSDSVGVTTATLPPLPPVIDALLTAIPPESIGMPPEGAYHYRRATAETTTVASSSGDGTPETSSSTGSTTIDRSSKAELLVTVRHRDGGGYSTEESSTETSTYSALLREWRIDTGRLVELRERGDFTGVDCTWDAPLHWLQLPAGVDDVKSRALCGGAGGDTSIVAEQSVHVGPTQTITFAGRKIAVVELVYTRTIGNERARITEAGTDIVAPALGIAVRRQRSELLEVDGLTRAFEHSDELASIEV